MYIQVFMLPLLIT